MGTSFPLDLIKQLIRRGRYRITVTALETAALMGFCDEDIVECVTDHLQESHFYKPILSTKVPGLMQDVYKISYEGERVYLKVQINKAGLAVIVSFKQDESWS